MKAERKCSLSVCGKYLKNYNCSRRKALKTIQVKKNWCYVLGPYGVYPIEGSSILPGVTAEPADKSNTGRYQVNNCWIG